MTYTRRQFSQLPGETPGAEIGGPMTESPAHRSSYHLPNIQRCARDGPHV